MYSLVSLLSGIYPFHAMHSLLVTIVTRFNISYKSLFKLEYDLDVII